jgi:UDP-N-acetylglucosamine 4-epimerase
VVQANILAGTVQDPEAVNKVYNVALGEQTSLNELFKSLRDLLSARDSAVEIPPPVYRDFRAGDVRFSRADISRAKRHLGFKPTVRVHEGLERAFDWYVARLSPQLEPA